jgi:hypothetical protein
MVVAHLCSFAHVDVRIRLQKVLIDVQLMKRSGGDDGVGSPDKYSIATPGWATQSSGQIGC